MAKLSTKQHSQTHRVLIFGGPKSGKTELAGRLAEFYDLIWVDMENGHETLFKLPAEWQQRIELINLPDTRSYPVAIETVLKMVKGPATICEQHGKVGCMVCKRQEAEEHKSCQQDEATKHSITERLFTSVNLPALGPDKVVVFDSLTQLSNSAIANITKNEPDDYKLNYDDWGNLGKLLDIFLSHIQQAGYNVVVISHEVEAETEGKKKTLVPVGGTRNFSRNVAKYFDHVVYAERKNRKHVFASSTSYSNTILTGSRTDVVMEAEENPSLLSIFKPELMSTKSTGDVGKKAEEAKTVGQTQVQKPAGSGLNTAALLAKMQARKK